MFWFKSIFTFSLNGSPRILQQDLIIFSSHSSPLPFSGSLHMPVLPIVPPAYAAPPPLPRSWGSSRRTPKVEMRAHATSAPGPYPAPSQCVMEYPCLYARCTHRPSKPLVVWSRSKGRFYSLHRHQFSYLYSNFSHGSTILWQPPKGRLQTLPLADKSWLTMLIHDTGCLYTEELLRGGIYGLYIFNLIEPSRKKQLLIMVSMRFVSFRQRIC